ncbi:glycosyl hydrolase family 47-domain-containing protein [Bombardia bombarda]|uniref:alpha-1,2-Mannosidase n=1 Tax=Bombardia bombarda TaxID=252184 RepID=A0AA39X0Y5_9PEZI|nr:glycosyl hydrolase family 47-domain-containing protein [Bombardia bombarda]
MFRIRRYRIFIVCAFVITVLLYHVSVNSQWERFPSAVLDSKNKADLHHPHAQPTPTPKSTDNHQKEQKAEQPVQQHKEPTIKIPQLKTTNEVIGGYGLPTVVPTPPPTPATPKKASVEQTTGAVRPPLHSIPAINLPDRVPYPGQNIKDQDEGIHAGKPLKHQPVETATVPHWKKPREWFPVPEESLILLPTGKPKPIPAVQHVFREESPAAKEKREHRLSKIKAEALRAWTGYKQYAWTHDELTPVTKGAKDPFCGWAATLVDALDTLWIMGLKDEFDNAVEAVRDIDFTTTPYRRDIPVFETIIRYLGGLLGAYDVAGGHEGKYRVLLDKAVELAEILMSVFDTPNRMPILYYNWKPEFNENPKRASTSVSVAELGSMGMEFTRLAQLTGKNKYYDAVARITDALEELQNRVNGTALNGIFPQQLDASGCNRTATALLNAQAASDAALKQAAEATDLAEDPQGYTPVPPQAGDNVQAIPKKNRVKDLEFEVLPGATPDEHSKGAFQKIDERGQDNAVVGAGKDAVAGANQTALLRRNGPPTTAPTPFSAKGLPLDWECVPQPLTSGGYGTDSYSMGGSQDSAYEYFPKQYALLGGLEPKYRTMHEKTVEATRKYLLFRPMAKGDPDILLSGKAFSADGTDKKLTYEWEITHLTCFLGGMFGLGGKMFDRPEDVEIGKRLADGCAWAYEVMPTGIMPEYAMMLPCKKADDCHFNKTAWYERLDPDAAWRNTQLEGYYVKKAEWKKEVEELKKNEAHRLEAEEEARRLKAKKQALLDEAEKAAEEDRRLRPVNNTLPGDEKPVLKVDYPARDAAAAHGLKGRDDEPKKQKRASASTGYTMSEDDATSSSRVKNKVEEIESELDSTADTGYQSRESRDEEDQKPIPEFVLPPEPNRPLSHEEFVAQRISRENLTPGFVSLNDRRYILRPEAIESVWYMYRITGDPIWQEKGWRMFEAVIKATQTEVGHSAIDDVTLADVAPMAANSMESFWLAETLKYFYLLFTTPDVISLDEWVFNTEAHPFKRPT